MKRNFLSRSWPVVFVGIVLILTIFPILWVFLLSLTENALDVLAGEKVKAIITFKNYRDLWQNSLFRSSFINSIFVTLIATVLSLGIALPCAYYLTIQRRRKKQSRGILLFNLWLLLTYMLPEFLFIIPMYIVYQKVGLYDTYFGLALLYQIHVLPFSIWMLSNFFQSDIPVSIAEAASIDGARHRTILFSIYTPLARSGIAALSILSAIWIWNELAIAIGLTFANAQTITVGVASFRGYASVNYGAMTAASIVSIVPMLIGAVFVQKHILRGLSAGAIK